jgi:hypothetical protein
MAKAQPQNEAQVVNLGDVTEKLVASPLTGELIPIQPMKALPDTHKHLAAVYPTASGWTQEAGSVALHF